MGRIFSYDELGEISTALQCCEASVDKVIIQTNQQTPDSQCIIENFENITACFDRLLKLLYRAPALKRPSAQDRVALWNIIGVAFDVHRLKNNPIIGGRFGSTYAFCEVLQIRTRELIEKAKRGDLAAIEATVNKTEDSTVEFVKQFITTNTSDPCNFIVYPLGARVQIKRHEITRHRGMKVKIVNFTGPFILTQEHLDGIVFMEKPPIGERIRLVAARRLTRKEQSVK